MLVGKINRTEISKQGKLYELTKFTGNSSLTVPQINESKKRFILDLDNLAEIPVYIGDGKTPKLYALCVKGTEAATLEQIKSLQGQEELGEDSIGTYLGKRSNKFLNHIWWNIEGTWIASMSKKNLSFVKEALLNELCLDTPDSTKYKVTLFSSPGVVGKLYFLEGVSQRDQFSEKYKPLILAGKVKVQEYTSTGWAIPVQELKVSSSF